MQEGAIPLPGLSAKVVKVDDYNSELPPDTEGMLLVKGPNRMMGYLKDQERTGKVLHNGWYITGDVAKIDEEGFIYIIGCLSRFSKIGGEMMPHVQIGETINIDKFPILASGKLDLSTLNTMAQELAGQ